MSPVDLAAHQREQGSQRVRIFDGEHAGELATLLRAEGARLHVRLDDGHTTYVALADVALELAKDQTPLPRERGS